MLLITMHHIVSDGWSRGVLVRELSELYKAYSRGDVDPLEPLKFNMPIMRHGRGSGYLEMFWRSRVLIGRGR